MASNKIYRPREDPDRQIGSPRWAIGRELDPDPVDNRAYASVDPPVKFPRRLSDQPIADDPIQPGVSYFDPILAAMQQHFDRGEQASRPFRLGARLGYVFAERIEEPVLNIRMAINAVRDGFDYGRGR